MQRRFQDAIDDLDKLVEAKDRLSAVWKWSVAAGKHGGTRLKTEQGSTCRVCCFVSVDNFFHSVDKVCLQVSEVRGKKGEKGPNLMEKSAFSNWQVLK